MEEAEEAGMEEDEKNMGSDGEEDLASKKKKNSIGSPKQDNTSTRVSYKKISHFTSSLP